MAVDLVKPYCSLADVQRETKSSGSELTDWYHTCINLASRWVDDFCGRDFWFHDYSESNLVVQRDRVLGDMVYLPWPVITLTDLWVYTDRTIGKTDNDKWATEDFYFTAGKAIVYSDKGSFGGHPFRANMVMRGTFGYALSGTDPNVTPPPTLPASVRRATILVAANISNQNRKEQVGLDGVRVELLTTEIGTEAKTLLKQHRAVATWSF